MRSSWQAQKDAIEKQFDRWFSYDLTREGKVIKLADSTKIEDKTAIYFFEKIVACVQDFSKTPLKDCTILDLACSEGLASLVFADYGVGSILGIDGREANVVKAKFAAQSLGFKNTHFQTQDVRTFKSTKRFDIILALGIAYHLDVPDVFHFFEKLSKLTSGIVVIDTQFSLVPKIKQVFKGHEYAGIHYQELHEYNLSNETSIGNPKSFWLTKSSLLNLLTQVGFTGIYQLNMPAGKKWRGLDDRIVLIATKEPHKKLPHLSTDPKTETILFSESNPWVVSANGANIDVLEDELKKIQMTN